MRAVAMMKTERILAMLDNKLVVAFGGRVFAIEYVEIPMYRFRR